MLVPTIKNMQLFLLLLCLCSLFVSFVNAGNVAIETLKNEGNNAFKEKNYTLAIKKYKESLNLCLACYDDCPLAKTVYSNLSACYLNLINFPQAEYYASKVDCETIHDLTNDLVCAKLLLRRALALEGQKKYIEALNFLQKLPGKVEEKQRVTQRIRRKLLEPHGNPLYWLLSLSNNPNAFYQFREFNYENSLISEFNSNIHGKGIKAVKQIHKGELLMIYSAFAISGNDTLATDLFHIFKNDPERGKEILKLYAGPSESLKKNIASLSDYQLKNVLFKDIARINNFVGSTLANVEIPNEKGYNLLAIRPSFFNHSCKPNAYWTVVGNAIFIRACEDIKPETEITISYYPCAVKNHENFSGDCKFCKSTNSSPVGIVQFIVQFAESNETLQKKYENRMKEFFDHTHLIHLKIKDMMNFTHEIDKINSIHPQNVSLFLAQGLVKCADVISSLSKIQHIQYIIRWYLISSIVLLSHKKVTEGMSVLEKVTDLVSSAYGDVFVLSLMYPVHVALIQNYVPEFMPKPIN